MRKAAAEAGSVIRWVSDNPIYLGSESIFNMSRTEFWSTTAGGKKYSMVYGSTGKVSAKDYFLGTIILLSGLLNAYYASLGKVYNYFFGAFKYWIMSFVTSTPPA